MDRMLYIGMSGAKQTVLAQAAVTNNLANASTTGFRADLAQFRSMQVFGPGMPTRVYAMAERPAVDFNAGPINATGNELDMAVKGDGWFAVQAADGGEAYTRAGDLRVTSAGLLVNGAGYPVIGNAGPIAVPPADKFEIGVDGTISVVPIGQPANGMMVVDRIKLVNPPPDQLEKGQDGLMRLRDGQDAPADAGVQLVAGALEGSNVSAVATLVQMIELQRQYEMQVKVMKSAEENAAQGTRLLSLA